MTREFESDDMGAMARLGYMDSPSISPVISSPVLQFPSHALLDLGLLDENFWEKNVLIGGFARETLFACFQSFLMTVPCRSNLKRLLSVIQI